VIKLLDRLKIKITPRFIASVMTFVLAGSSLRVIDDAHIGIIHPPLSYLLITPNIYFMVIAITVICLWISTQLHRAILVKDFHLIFAGSGLLWFFVNLIILLHFEPIVSDYIPLFVIAAGSGLTFAFYMIARSLSYLSSLLELFTCLIHSLKMIYSPQT
jgi:uncharacterized membrane protein